ncbi:MAG: hypothetical protein U0414_14920 [Polyangiaceae bacterium]
MNEYTRREEVRWIVVAAVAVVACIGGSMASLATATGQLVPDPEARSAAESLKEKAAALQECPKFASLVAKELPAFKQIEETALTPPEPPAPPPSSAPPFNPRAPKPVEKKKPTPKDDTKLAWPGAEAIYGYTQSLAKCDAPVRAALAPSDSAEPGWKAIAAAAAIVAPPQDNEPARLEAAKQLYGLLKDAPIAEVTASVEAAAKKAEADAAAAEEKAKSATVRKPLARGLLGREAAIGGGVLISLIALLVHFFSLRATSSRRATALIALRSTAATPQRGLQAAAIMRLAAEPNGGEPGLVLGCGLGGLIAAVVARSDADWFVVGVMGGLLLGLLVQLAIRFSGGSESRFRSRALELSEVEKPTVPIVLVLSAIEKGREAEFLDAFLQLPKEQQRESVEKLAQQAEERILVAADAEAAKALGAPP